MPYANPADKRARAARQYAANKGYFRDKHVRWRTDNPKRHAFLGQRHTSNQRGVDFDLTFEQWRDWWGADFYKRGKKPFDLQMCRYGDRGSYRIGNIYKATTAENKMGSREKDEGLHEDIPF